MKKIHKIWGLGLIVVLLVSMLGIVVPASAGTLSWSSETIPGSTGKVILDCDITDMDISPDGTIWASTNTTTLYKSTDGGSSWTAVTHSGLLTVDMVAVAPDNANIIAAASSNKTTPNVCISNNGGTTWSSLTTPQEGSEGSAMALTGLDVSPASSGYNYVAVCGWEWTSGTQLANVWSFNVGAAAAVWTEFCDREGFNEATTAVGTADIVSAIAFSPNFPSDKVLTAIVEDSGAVSLEITATPTSSGTRPPASAITPMSS